MNLLCVANITICIVCLIVNCSEAGEGTVTADIRHVGKDVSCEVNADEEEQDLFQVLFKPFESGTYFVYVKFNGQEIAGKFWEWIDNIIILVSSLEGTILL